MPIKKKRPIRNKSESELNLIKLKKRFSSMIAIQRKQLRSKNLNATEKNKIDADIVELLKKRTDIEKQIKIFAKVLIDKQVKQLASIDMGKVSIVTKTDTSASLSENLFEDDLDDFVKKLAA